MRAPQLLLAIALTVLFVTGLAVTAWAQTQQQRLDGKLRFGQEVVVGAEEVLEHDLYASGGRVEVAGTIDGDLVAAAGQIVVRGTVTGDVIIAGGTLRILGTVGETVRAAGGEVVIAGDVGQDVVGAGGQVRIADTGAVGGDFIFGGGQITHDGVVEGSAVGRAGQYTGEGTIAGSEQVVIEDDDEEEPGIGQRIGAGVQRYASLLVVAALLLWVARRPLNVGIERIQRQPLPSLGAGLAGIIGAVAALVIAVLAIVVVALLLALSNLGALAGLAAAGGGLAVGALVLAFVIMLAFVAQIVVGLWLGRLAVRDVASWPRTFGAAALGLAAIVVVIQIPVLGPMVRVLVVLLGFGGLVLATRRLWRSGPDRPPQEPQPAT